jgi:hypothetical protein
VSLNLIVPIRIAPEVDLLGELCGFSFASFAVKVFDVPTEYDLLTLDRHGP